MAWGNPVGGRILNGAPGIRCSTKTSSPHDARVAPECLNKPLWFVNVVNWTVAIEVIRRRVELEGYAAQRVVELGSGSDERLHERGDFVSVPAKLHTWEHEFLLPDESDEPAGCEH